MVHLESPGQRPPFDYLRLLLKNLTDPFDVKHSAWMREHGCRASLTDDEAIFIPAFWTHAVHGEEKVVVSQINFWFDREMELEDAARAEKERRRRAEKERRRRRRAEKERKAESGETESEDL